MSAAVPELLCLLHITTWKDRGYLRAAESREGTGRVVNAGIQALPMGTPTMEELNCELLAGALSRSAEDHVSGAVAGM